MAIPHRAGTLSVVFAFLLLPVGSDLNSGQSADSEIVMPVTALSAAEHNLLAAWGSEVTSFGFSITEQLAPQKYLTVEHHVNRIVRCGSDATVLAGSSHLTLLDRHLVPQWNTSFTDISGLTCSNYRVAVAEGPQVTILDLNGSTTSTFEASDLVFSLMSIGEYILIGSPGLELLRTNDTTISAPLNGSHYIHSGVHTSETRIIAATTGSNVVEVRWTGEPDVANWTSTILTEHPTSIELMDIAIAAAAEALAYTDGDTIHLIDSATLTQYHAFTPETRVTALETALYDSLLVLGHEDGTLTLHHDLAGPEDEAPTIVPAILPGRPVGGLTSISGLAEDDRDKITGVEVRFENTTPWLSAQLTGWIGISRSWEFTFEASAFPAWEELVLEFRARDQVQYSEIIRIPLLVVPDINEPVLITEVHPAVGPTDDLNEEFDRVNPEDLFWIVVRTYNPTNVPVELEGLWSLSRSDNPAQGFEIPIEIDRGLRSIFVPVHKDYLESGYYTLHFELQDQSWSWEVQIFSYYGGVEHEEAFDLLSWGKSPLGLAMALCSLIILCLIVAAVGIREFSPRNYIQHVVIPPDPVAVRDRVLRTELERLQRDHEN